MSEEVESYTLGMFVHVLFNRWCVEDAVHVVVSVKWQNIKDLTGANINLAIYRLRPREVKDTRNMLNIATLCRKHSMAICTHQLTTDESRCFHECNQDINIASTFRWYTMCTIL